LAGVPGRLDDGVSPDAGESGPIPNDPGAFTMIDRRRDPRRHRNRPIPEILEDRRLLASLAGIANLTVPAQQGYALSLDGSGTTDAQNFTITRTSGSANITADIVSGPFWTLNVQYTDPTNAQNDFSGPLVFQLFNNAGSTSLTPHTVSMFQQFTNDGYYTNTGKYITRIAPNFPGATDYVVQGGAATTNGTGSSGQPNTPFANENVQQLAFTGSDQLAMANSGGTNSNDTQFFITTGQPNSELGYNYTIFGQMVPNPTSSTVPSDSTTLGKLTQIPVMFNSALQENSQPTFNPIFTSVTLANSNPSGTLLLDTTQARPGDTATFQVTATDPTTNTTMTQSFTVTAGAYGGPTDPPIPFAPLADPVSATVAEGSSTTITLAGRIGYPDPHFPYPGTVVYPQSLVSQPSHGTISSFDSSKGTFVYTPQPGYSGPDSFQYRAQDTFSSANSAPATVTINVTPPPTTPTINWSNPADITYGTALSGTQLDATASVLGTFTYSPAIGTVLHAGTGQVLSVTFTPNDTADYTTANARVTINVNKATPTITWATPADITQRTALGPAQLDATASVPGTFTYSPGIGKVLLAGAGQPLSVTFTPTDTTDYTAAMASVTINVAAPAPTGTPTVVGSLTGVDDVTNSKHQVTALTLSFDGSIDPAAAGQPTTYALIQQGKHHTFNLRRGPKIKIKSASYDPSRHTVTLIPRKPFASKKPVQVFIGGQPVSIL
jgi:cyclophilin family peptidyl-prolyl cis-trans isomerase